MSQRSLEYGTPSPTPAKARIGPLAAGGLVLLVYPFCLLANVMSLAAVPAPGTAVKPLPLIASKVFLWSSTLYPLVYLLAAGASLLLASNERRAVAHRVAQVPLVYLLFVLLCFGAWIVAA